MPQTQAMLRAMALAMSVTLSLAGACDDNGRVTSIDAGSSDRESGSDMDAPGDVSGDTSGDLEEDAATVNGDAPGDAGDDNDGSNPGDAMAVAACPADPFFLPTLCSGYCSNMDRSCTGNNKQFDSFQSCYDVCAKPTWSCGLRTDTTGDSVFCRINHAMAADSSPDIECPSAGPISATCR